MRKNRADKPLATIITSCKCGCHINNPALSWIRNKLQGTETQLDSLTQKLARPNVLNRHTQNSLFQQGKTALMLVRKIQFRYFNIDTLSMLRYNDCKFDPITKKIIRPLDKNNWYKYKKLQDIKKGKQKVLN